MTIETLICEDSYVADGTTNPRNIGFPVADPSFLTVEVDGVLQTLGTDYIIDGDYAGGNGRIVPQVAWASGAAIDYYRATRLVQAAAIPAGKPLPSRSLEAQLDRDVMRIQEIGALIARAPLTPRRGGVAGQFSVVLPDGSWGFASGTGADSALREDIASLDSDKGAGLVAFTQETSYAQGTMGLALRDRGLSVTDTPFLANRVGTANAHPAFASALAALPSRGGKVAVPFGEYRLDADPTVRDKSVYWDIDVGAKFTGAGTGEHQFPYMFTNFTQMAVGPYIYSYTYEKSTNPGGGTAAFNVEAVQPADYGAGQTVAGYFGGYTNNPNAGGNVWAINTLTWAGPQAGGVFHGIEVDVNNDSLAGARLKGVSISGAGTVDCLSALEITRAAKLWQIGISMDNVLNGIFMFPKTGGTGITLNGAGVSAVGIGGTNLTVMQLDNGKDAVLLQRITDLSPSGYFIRAVNQLNSDNLFFVDVAGNMQIAGTFKAAIYPAFADNAAAVAGGLTVGQHYRTGDTVKQVH